MQVLSLEVFMVTGPYHSLSVMCCQLFCFNHLQKLDSLNFFFAKLSFADSIYMSKIAHFSKRFSKFVPNGVKKV